MSHARALFTSIRSSIRSGIMQGIRRARGVLALFVSAGGLCMTTASSPAAVVNLSEPPVVESEVLVTGTASSGGSFEVRVSWDADGDQRGAFEYPLPALPAGATITGA